MPLAIGIDVSELRMGWAIVDYEDQTPLALGVENLRQRDGGWPEDQVLGAMETVFAKIRLGGYDKRDVYVVGIEDAYAGPNIKGTIRHAGIVGMATMAARVVFGPSVTYWPIPNGTWLAPLGIKPASRKRADVKAATMEWALRRCEEEGSGELWRRMFQPEADIFINQDMADALGIATACALLTEKREAA